MNSKRILLFGPPRIEADGETVDVSRRKALALLVYVAATGQPHGRDSLATLFWPELSQTRSRGNLRRVLSDLNQELGEGWLTLDGETVALAADEAIWLDVARFRDRLAAALRHDHAPEAVCRDCLPFLTEAADLYQADFMAGFSLRDCPEFDDWQYFETESLRRDYATTLERLVTYLSEHQGHDAAVGYARRWVTLDRLNEAAHRQRMRLYASSGRRHDALRQYQTLVETLEEELGVSPDEETQALYQAIAGGTVTKPPAPAQRPAWILPTHLAIEMERGAPLVGRDEELAWLERTMQETWHGQGRTALLAADAGVGKTRLACEALRQAVEAGMTVLVGGAYEEEGHLAYHPFIEAFDRFLSERGRPPEQNPITHYKPLGVTDLQKEHSALFLATTSFLTGLAQEGPVVLLLDDLHAADEASLSLFHYLARQTRAAPIVLLATYRTDIIQNSLDPFGSLLNALYRERLSDVLRLEPLAADAGTVLVEHVLEGPVDPALAAAVYDMAEGNPFYVQEIARAMQNADQVVQAEGRWHLRQERAFQIPAGLQGLLAGRVERLGEMVESTLTAAAVIGREFRFSVLRYVTELSDDDLLDALDLALDAHLLEETDAGYRFQHSLIRHTLYTGLSRRRRARLHGLTGQALEATFGTRPGRLEPFIEALAYHYDLSDRREQALPYLQQAAEKAIKVFAIEVASDYLGRALALMDEVGVSDPPLRWALLEQAGNLAKVLADTARAVTYYEQALAMTPVPDAPARTTDWQPSPGDRIRVHRSLARTLIASGRMAEADQQLDLALALVEGDGEVSLDHANLLYDVALWHWHTDGHQVAFDAAQRSLAIAEQLDSDTGRAQAYEMLALACHSLGEWQQGLTFEQQRSTIIGPNLDVTEAFDAHL